MLYLKQLSRKNLGIGIEAQSSLALSLALKIVRSTVAFFEKHFGDYVLSFNTFCLLLYNTEKCY